MVEQLLEAGNPSEETFRLLAPDAEIKPIESDQVLRGLPEIKRHAAALGPENYPLVRAATLYEVGESALVYTLIAMARERGENRFTETFPVGWVVTFRGEQIVRIYSYPSWEEAREAVGMTAEDQERLTPRRRIRGFMIRARAALRRAPYLRPA
jgi:hypothetical protein